VHYENKTYIILIVIVVLLATVFILITRPSLDKQADKTIDVSDRWIQCPYNSGYIKTTDDLIYVNKILGFSISIPEGWNIPNTTNTDPHFYDCEHKDGFEIQGGFQIAPESYYEILSENSKDQLHTKIISSYTKLIPKAVVDEYTIIDPEEGNSWPHWNDVFLNSERRAFGFGSYKPIDQYPFIQTFKLLK
jgi:hypothetical protein